MKETVYKEDAIYAIKNMMGIAQNEKIVTKESAMYALRALPSADRTGKWMVGDAFPHNVYCSNCFATYAQEKWEVWADGTLPRNYCPNCGSYNGGDGDE